MMYPSLQSICQSRSSRSSQHPHWTHQGTLSLASSKDTLSAVVSQQSMLIIYLIVGAAFVLQSVLGSVADAQCELFKSPCVTCCVCGHAVLMLHGNFSRRSRTSALLSSSSSAKVQWLGSGGIIDDFLSPDHACQRSDYTLPRVCRFDGVALSWVVLP
jgi:hypothetical protein